MAVSKVRRGLAVAAGVTLGGVALELLVTRHWGKFERNIAWFVVGYLVFVFVMALWARRRNRAARIAAFVGVFGAVYGVVEHVVANYEAGPLDYRFATRWATMSTAERVWAAVNGSVGPAPLLAPLMLAQASLLIFGVAYLNRPSDNR